MSKDAGVSGTKISAPNVAKSDTLASFDKFAGWTECLDDGQISQRDPVRQISQDILNSSYHIQIFDCFFLCTTEKTERFLEDLKI